MSKAIAIRRVSSKKQAENNHSLAQQDTSVQNMAAVMEVTIVKEWAMPISAKKGNNLKRKDLQEALNYCRYSRGVKYLLIDKVSRFARELKMIFYFIVEFEKLGVKVVFCDPHQQKFNADTAEAMYELARKAYDAEAENEERSQTSTTKMKARVALGYYPFHPHQGYQKTEAADGLHVPDPLRFALLQKALKATASLSMTPKEAQLWLTANGYLTPAFYWVDKDGHKIKKGERPLDLNHFTKIMQDSYYAGIVAVEGWPVNKHGLHKPMITIEEYEINLAVAKGRKVRRKQKYNPDFPLNISWHEPCRESDGKLTGINHSNGKGWKRKEYLCRYCRKRIPQAKVHSSMNQLLNRVTKRQDGLTELKKALKQVWGNNEAYRLDRLANLKERKDVLLAKKSEFLRSLAANPELANDFKEEINKIKAEITDIDIQMAKDDRIDEEFTEFTNFALDYTDDLRERWWQLSGEKLAECKQLLFRGEIIVQPSGNVYTPFLSYIYTLQNENDDPKIVKNHDLVELRGTAPRSER